MVGSSSSSLNPLRAMARSASKMPIETITVGFCIVTLAYFQLLHAVKHSEFLHHPSALPWTEEIRSQDSNGVEDASVAILTRNEAGKWIEAAPGHSSEAITVTLNRVVVGLDAELALQEDDRNILVYPARHSAPVLQSDPIPETSFLTSNDATLLDHDAQASLRDFENHVKSATFGPSSSRHFTDACYKSPASHECFSYSFDPTADPSGQGKSALLALGFKPTTDSQDWSQSVLSSIPSSDSRGYSYVPLSSLQTKPADHGLGLSFKAFPPTRGFSNTSSASTFNDEEARSVRWMLYALRAFVMRFYALARKADSADIFVMLIGYLLMHLTFINTFMNMRKLGSKFWLGCSVLVSGTFGFLLALFTASLIGISINPIILSEALPFLIITVGFEKPFVLARAVFTNPALTPVTKDRPELRSRTPSRAHIYPSTATNSRVTAFGPNPELDESLEPIRSSGIRWGQPVPSKDIVLQGFDKVGKHIVRDYAIEIAVLIAGSFTGVSGLKEFCQLAALILLFDCLFLFGFFASVLTVMVEVRRIRIMRGLRRVDSSADLAHILDDGTTPDLNKQEDVENLPAKQRIMRLIFGNPSGEPGKNGESPTARLKLLLISAFLVLHALNLCTTLTTKTAITRHSEASTVAGSALSSASLFMSHLVSTDPTSSSLAPVLEKLSALHPSYELPLVVQVPPPVIYRLVLPGQSISSIAGTAAKFTDGTRVASSMAILDRFMSSWTTLVGDPVLSKWIVIVLIVSVFLNGYLLKGIAVGDQSIGEGYLPSSAPEAAARLLLGSQADSTQSKIKRRWSGGIEGMARGPSEYTLADAAEMAKERRKELIQSEKERDAAHLQAAKAKKSRKPSESAGSSDDSAPGSPLFMSTKKRLSQPISGRLISANETPMPHPPPTALPPLLELPNGKPLHSETSSESATDTPATTVLDETDVETPTVHLDSTGVRPLEELITVFAAGKGADLVNDEEVILLVQKGKVAAYALEKLLKDNLRAVKIRRALISRASTTKSLETSLLPYTHYDYSKVVGQCCENVVGYTPIPVGIAGPLRIDGVALPIPMATTEGALVASTSRGCKALNAGGGVSTVVTQDAMTRGPALEFPSVVMCGAAKKWIDSEEGSTIMKAAFNSTSRFARLQHLKAAMAGRTLFVRFATQTGDAMGMNMISKGTERALETMQTEHFPDMKITSLSGNYCTDKKPAAINWIEGRGKSVVAEGIVPGNIVKTILKTTVQELVKVNITKNLVGSAMAGTMGGNNAHSSNILSAIFLATGQDPAQNVESSNCMTLMEAINDGQDLLITCTMPSIEVGTIGGGTILPPQLAMLTMLGVNGPHPTHPGENARQLARIICAAVVAGELSLMSALAQGSLVQSHMALNRSAPATPATVQVTGHSYLTPAPTRPGTPGPGSFQRQHSNLHLMTPMHNSPKH